MGKRLSRLLWGALFFAAWTFPAAARGDKYIPQVADGAGRIRTKIDIHNLSPSLAISKAKLFFFRQDGSPWVLATNLGTADQYLLDLGRNQTIRVETLGISEGLNSGYAVIRDTEGNSITSSDYQLAVSVFYEVLDAMRVVDTVSVPIGEPCLRWVMPVETDVERGLLSGIAIVNLANSSNQVTFKLWTAYSPSSADGSDGGSVTLSLKPGEQRARFLVEPGFFPQYSFHKGVLVGTAEKPVAVLGLLQTQVAGGVQYATLAAEYTDALHSESFVYLPQGSSLDADATRVPYVTLDDGGSFDLQFQAVSSSARKFLPLNGAMLSPLGVLSENELNSLTVEDLQGAPYSPFAIELSDNAVTLVPGMTLALKTSRGRFAKLRVDRIINSGEAKDIVLQVYVYR